MATALGSGVVVYRRTGGLDAIDAIDEYSQRLIVELSARGIEARYEPNGLSSVLAARVAPCWVVLQYNPFRYGRWGFAPALVRDALRLRRGARVPLAIMVHEAWVPMTDWRSTLMGLWQRVQLRTLVRLANRVMTSTEALACGIGHGAVHIPIATNITPIPTSHQAARVRLGVDGKLTIALFGGAHPTRALDHAEAAIAALAEAHGTHRLVVLNLGADAPSPRVPPGLEVRPQGRQTAAELSLGLSASDIVLLPFTDGVSTRRTSVMAALAHGRPVLGLNGHSTDTLLAEAHDAIVLTPAGDPAAFALAAVQLTGDPERLGAIGDAGRQLYNSHFDWPVVARNFAAELETMTPTGTAANA